MQKQQSKTCKSCKACKYIYRRLWYTYSRFEQLYCTDREEPTEADNSCDRWQKKAPRKYDLSPQRFDEAERDIKILVALSPDE